MKPIYENIEKVRGNESLVVYKYQTTHFPFKWHYHPEYELTLITNGSGNRLIGDSYENFEPGDLVLIGSNLPHTWISASTNGNAAAIVIQFSENFIQPFLQYPECKQMETLLKKSKRGLAFKKNTGSIAKKINELLYVTGVKKLLGLIDILNQLSTIKPSLLSTDFYTYTKGTETEQRINKVCMHLYKHYKEPLSITDVAKIVYLSPAAFCKFFKKITGKTFSDYVNDIRIGRAISLLIESDKNITAIAYDVGFESITYFNRVFHRKKLTTPSAFRNQFGNTLPQ